MYTATVKEKKVLEQHEFILLTVELESDELIPAPADRPVLNDDGTPKLKKNGQPKMKKGRAKKKTKTIYFKFPITTTWDEMKVQIKARIDSLEAAESDEIPIGTPIVFTP